MAQNFAGIPTQNYIGAFFRLPVRQTQGRPSPPNLFPPSVVPAKFNWLVYWTAAGGPESVGVNCNLQAQSQSGAIMDRIAAVKIDNTGSVSPVYIYFPDTGDVVACPPNATVVENVFTNSLTCVVYAKELQANFIPSTNVWFYNLPQEPFLDPEANFVIPSYKASPVIQRGNTILNSIYGVPALGDQFYELPMSLSAGGILRNLWGTPYTDGFIYLTNLVLMASIVQGTAGQIPSIAGFVIESTGPSGTLFQCLYGFNAGAQVNQQLLSMTGMNLKLDATQMWQARVITGVPTGQVTFYSAFTKTNL